MCLFGVSTFQLHFNPFQPQKVIFWRIFPFCSFLVFVPHITPLQIEVGSWNLLSIMSKSPRCVFWYFNFFGSKFNYAPIWERECWEVKNIKFGLFWVKRLKIKSCITYPKINLPSQLGGGEIWSFLTFFTSKKFCSSPIYPPNWAKKLKSSMYI